jgi:hypothetical protein
MLGQQKAQVLNRLNPHLCRFYPEGGLPSFPPENAGAHKAQDPWDFVADLRISRTTPHIGQNIQARRSLAINDRTARHQGYGQ